jgi:hypothetical protein
VSVTGDWSPGQLEDLVGLLGVRIAAWNHMQYPENVPAPGDHSADAITAGHGAVKVIDEIIRDLHALRSQLVDELRTDEDANAARVDAMLAAPRAPRVPAEEKL